MNSPTRTTSRFRTRWLPLGLLTFYWAMIFMATHRPSSGDGGGIPHMDKLAHLTAYALLGFLLAWNAALIKGRSVWKGPLLILAAYAVLDEILQIPLPTRQGDWLDVLADLIGGIAGIGAFFWVHRWSWVGRLLAC